MSPSTNNDYGLRQYNDEPQKIEPVFPKIPPHVSIVSNIFWNKYNLLKYFKGTIPSPGSIIYSNSVGFTSNFVEDDSPFYYTASLASLAGPKNLNALLVGAGSGLFLDSLSYQTNQWARDFTPLNSVENASIFTLYDKLNQLDARKTLLMTGPIMPSPYPAIFTDYERNNAPFIKAIEKQEGEIRSHILDRINPDNGPGNIWDYLASKTTSPMLLPQAAEQNSTMKEEPFRVVALAMDESTSNGTYNNPSRVLFTSNSDPFPTIPRPSILDTANQLQEPIIEPAPAQPTMSPAEQAFLAELEQQAALEAANMLPEDGWQSRLYPPPPPVDYAYDDALGGMDWQAADEQASRLPSYRAAMSSSGQNANPIGSAIGTAYGIASFGSTLQDVLTGRRSDPGAYLSLANSTAQGLNWLAKTDGVKDIVSAIGDLQGPLDTMADVTGGAMSGWGLYQNIAGLANGEVNAQNVLGAVANTSALYKSVTDLLPKDILSQIPGEFTNAMGGIGNIAGGALSAIGLVQGVQGLLEGEAQSPMDVLGLANNAYGTYSAITNLSAMLGTSGEAVAGVGAAAAGAEAGAAAAAGAQAGAAAATAGAATMMGVVAPALMVLAAGQILGALTHESLSPQDAQELIAAQGEFLGGSVYAPQGSLSEAILGGAGAPPSLRQDQADSINLMETVAGRAGYSQDQVHGMVVDQMGYLAPGAIAAANRFETLDTVFNESEMERLSNPDNWYERDQAMQGMGAIGASLGVSPQELGAQDGGFGLAGDQDQLQVMLDKLKELSLVMVEADSGLSSLVGNFQGLGENLGLSQEAIPAFNEQMLTLSAQLLQGQIGVDGFASGVQSIASGLGLSSEQGAALVQTVLAMLAPLGQGGAAAGILRGEVGGAADALGRAVDAGQGLIGAANGLGGALTVGAIEAAAAGGVIDASLVPGLTRVTDQAAIAAAEAGAMAGAIQSIPTSWQSNLYFTRYYQTVGEPFHSGGFVFHQGGLVLHAGGLADAPRLHDGGWFNELLKPYEVPAILQRGEYVVRQQSVTPQTLPWLRQVNQTGALPGEGGGTQVHINAPLVQVQGGLTSDPEAIEGLARLVEAKLMDLQDGRFGGEAAYL